MDLITEQIHQPFVGVATCLNEAAPCNIAVCTENLIRIDEVKESPKLTE